MSALQRIAAVTGKELRQLSRDRLTFGMVVMIPLIQLLLFGYAINTVVRPGSSLLPWSSSPLAAFSGSWWR